MRTSMGSDADRHTWRAAGDVLATIGNALLAGVASYAGIVLLGLLVAAWERPVGTFVTSAAPWLAVVAVALVCRSRGRLLILREERGQPVD